MKTILTGLSSAVMVVYVMYRAFTTLVILPFVASPLSSSGIYFLSTILLATLITGLSLTRRNRVAFVLASLLLFAALFYWWLVICRRSTPIWPDFFWFVVPETCFAIAVLCRWLVDACQSLPEKQAPLAL